MVESGFAMDLEVGQTTRHLRDPAAEVFFHEWNLAQECQVHGIVWRSARCPRKYGPITEYTVTLGYNAPSHSRVEITILATHHLFSIDNLANKALSKE